MGASDIVWGEGAINRISTSMPWRILSSNTSKNIVDGTSLKRSFSINKYSLNSFFTAIPATSWEPLLIISHPWASPSQP